MNPVTAPPRVFKSRWFQRFAAREQIGDPALLDAVSRAENGQIDAALGGDVIKQRIARSGQGKSGGYRAIILFRHSVRAIFVYGFPKNARENIEDSDVRDFRDLAKALLSAPSEAVESLLREGKLIEVRQHESKRSISK
ncbi:MAG: type II toxin-antitoxin system RelE/ParE family toxin [Bryobacteraceae bacterium]|nr:type II toxin-antitoxin system RelE/ParE family toxin [Bryobacteraceae bacterium]